MSEIVFNSPLPNPSPLNSQVESLQTTLASLNQQVIILQEALQERDQEIADLKQTLASYSKTPVSDQRLDNTLTIIGIFINLYRFIFLPGKVA